MWGQKEPLKAEDMSAETRATLTADFQLDLAHGQISPRLHQDVRYLLQSCRDPTFSSIFPASWGTAAGHYQSYQSWSQHIAAATVLPAEHSSANYPVDLNRN